MTDTVNVPREWLERIAWWLISSLKDGLGPDEVHHALCDADYAKSLLAAAPKAECELETQEREEKALRDQMFARVDRLFDAAQPEASKVEQDHPCDSHKALGFCFDPCCPHCPADLEADHNARHNRSPASDELLEADLRVVADTMKEMQDHIERLTGARHSMYDGAVGIARSIAKHKGPQS